MRRFSWKWAAVAVFCCWNPGAVVAYEDDDLLCRPGWSPEIMQQQIQERNYQQRMGALQYQQAMIDSAAHEQRTAALIKSARQARAAKAAQKRDELIARRKAEMVSKNSASNQAIASKAAP